MKLQFQGDIALLIEIRNRNVKKFHSTAKRKLERLQFSTSSSFVKICSAPSGEFKVYF